MADILKFMHCGCEYNFCSSDSPTFTEDIFGDGSDGDCHFTYNRDTAGHITIPAQEYNFCNLCIDECVTLHFCGEGIPVIKVKENFVNNGTIQLRNPLLCSNYEEYIQGLDKVVHNKCNCNYTASCTYYNCECFSLLGLSTSVAKGGVGGTTSCGGEYVCSGGDGGAAGCSGTKGCGVCCATEGGSSAYSNAGGGGGAGGLSVSWSCPVYSTRGCDAPADGIGGDGATGYGESGNSSDCLGFSGGGGGYGFYQGGKGGDSIQCNYSYARCPGNGGNSYAGNGGDGGNSVGTGRQTATKGGNGGNTYYGKGGNGGSSGYATCGDGGCSMYGDGGTGCRGGNSLFGKGGDGTCHGGNGLDGGNGCSSIGLPRGGVYGFGLFANNIYNQGTIYGRGGDGGTGMNANSCINGTDGAEIYIVVGCEYCNAGEISCRAGKKGNYSNPSCASGKDGKPGFVKFYHM